MTLSFSSSWPRGSARRPLALLLCSLAGCAAASAGLGSSRSRLFAVGRPVLRAASSAPNAALVAPLRADDCQRTQLRMSDTAETPVEAAAAPNAAPRDRPPRPPYGGGGDRPDFRPGGGSRGPPRPSGTGGRPYGGGGPGGPSSAQRSRGPSRAFGGDNALELKNPLIFVHKSEVDGSGGDGSSYGGGGGGGGGGRGGGGGGRGGGDNTQTYGGGGAGRGPQSGSRAGRAPVVDNLRRNPAAADASSGGSDRDGVGSGRDTAPKRFTSKAPASKGAAWAEKRREDGGRGDGRKAAKARFSDPVDDEERGMRGKSKRGKAGRAGQGRIPVKAKLTAVTIPEVITVGDLATLLESSSVTIIKDLMKRGILASISQPISGEDAAAVAEGMGLIVTRGTDIDAETRALEQEDDDVSSLVPRPPIVTVMGHVDHGKTSLLDALRQTRVALGEAGGITQHLGSYQVTSASGKVITYLDTPGHAAFSAMRSRGANVTDIVVLVVAADDGVKQQTVEAIKAAKAANTPIIVAVNKVDKEGADIERVGVELLDHDVVLEKFGGDVMSAPVSAKERTGLEGLEEKISLLAELLDLKANPDRRAEGVAVEARMERGVGPVATTIVQRGTLRVGDIVVAGSEWGRVRKLLINGQEVESAGPGSPVDVLGLQGVCRAGDSLRVATSEQQARQIADVRSQRDREERAAALFNAVADQKRGELFGELVKDTKRETVDVVIKADVQGSAEALRSAIEELVQVDSFGYSAKCRVLRAEAGSLTLEDIQLASVSNALVIAFNVAPGASALAEAEKLGIDVVRHSIVYDALDDVSARLSALVAPPAAKWLGTVTGRADVLQIFKIGKGVGMVAGCKVTEGAMKRGSNLRVVRGKSVMHEGSINQLRYLKDEVDMVETGSECGISFETFDGVKVGDVIECYVGGRGEPDDDDARE